MARAQSTATDIAFELLLGALRIKTSTSVAIVQAPCQLNRNRRWRWDSNVRMDGGAERDMPGAVVGLLYSETNDFELRVKCCVRPRESDLQPLLWRLLSRGALNISSWALGSTIESGTAVCILIELFSASTACPSLAKNLLHRTLPHPYRQNRNCHIGPGVCSGPRQAQSIPDPPDRTGIPVALRAGIPFMTCGSDSP